MKTFETNSYEETFMLAKNFAKKIRGERAVICLGGDLGAGKTAFAKGMASGLGIDESIVCSPTFTIVNEYEGEKRLYHFDVYRIDDPYSMYDIGFEEYLESGICVIEWAEKIEPVLPKERIEILIKKDLNKGEDYRIIAIRGCLGEDFSN